MKKGLLSVTILLLLAFETNYILAQTTSSSSNFVAQPIPDRTVSFGVADAGVSKPIECGLDLAWLSESNIRRGIAFMGVDRVKIVRASFQPTLPLVNGDIQGQQITDLNTRLGFIDLTGTKTKVMLNCDHPSVDASYVGNAANWALLIDATTKRVQARGRTVVSVSPFNEPDFGWGQYSGSNGQLDFLNICTELRKNSRFDSIRISGGNTLNCDQALPWYNYLKTKLDEGNTHQLAGTFDNFANFFTNVRSSGDHATGDELHNVMEAMVGSEYGLQTGIWWGTAELARGELVKATDGKRLGYAEHRPNWTAAAVYRNLDGKVQAFGGTSERQAATTTFRFVSKDRDVYYDGYGPQREYTMVLPGGTGYQTGQTNAERVVNITWGADIQPVINGKYILVNRNSGKVLSVPLGATTAGTILRQYANIGATYQQWNVTPVDSRIGGDYSYFTFTAVNSSMAMDLLNFSLDNGGAIEQYTDSKNGAQQWYLDYADNGWFYIRSRTSAKCVEVAGSSSAAGAAIQQWDKTGATNQQWRFLPVGTTIEFVPPLVPTNLTATAYAKSIRLNWTASPDADVAGYTIFRAETAGGPYNTMARNVTTTSFVDNTAAAGTNYFYAIKAVDNALNRSAYSSEVSATATGANDLVAQLLFEGNTQDSTLNLNHSSSYGTTAFVAGKIGTYAISLNGTNAYVQLPPYVATQKEITIATWLYWRGGAGWQRIFDFGNDQTQYMFLTPNTGSGQMRFSIKNGGAEQQLNTTAISIGKWTHVALTLSATAAHLYVNGVLATESSAITISPADIKPILNYIGRSQFSDPLLNGYIDNFSVYNYALPASDIAQIATGTSAINDAIAPRNIAYYANNQLYLNLPNTRTCKVTIYNMVGQTVQTNTNVSAQASLPLALPAGFHIVNVKSDKTNYSFKIKVN